MATLRQTTHLGCAGFASGVGGIADGSEKKEGKHLSTSFASPAAEIYDIVFQMPIRYITVITTLLQSSFHISPSETKAQQLVHESHRVLYTPYFRDLLKKEYSWIRR